MGKNNGKNDCSTYHPHPDYSTETLHRNAHSPFETGIDVSKAKVDVASTKDGKKIIANATFDNNMEGFKKLSKWIKKHSDKSLKVHCCMESTGIYHEVIAEFLQEKFIVSVINPYQSKAFAQLLV
ncbi:MAG: IS110 family transposase [Sediminibacterium sp.]|nr:IS110 family transposase [Sediminibacterium sp.]